MLPLNASTTTSETRTARASPSEEPTGGARIAFERISVRAGGHLILEDIEACIEAGEHVAVVGRSGAGKSSLLGVLLGWHTAGAGRVVPLRTDAIAAGLVELLADPERLRTMGENGFDLVNRVYTWDHMTDELLDAYEQGIARSRTRGTCAADTPALR